MLSGGPREGGYTLTFYKVCDVHAKNEGWGER